MLNAGLGTPSACGSSPCEGEQRNGLAAPPARGSKGMDWQLTLPGERGIEENSDGRYT